MGLLGKIVEEGAEGGDFPGTGGGGESVASPAAVGLLGPVAAEVGQIAVDVCQGDGADKRDVHVQDGNLVPGRILERTVPGLLHIAEEIAQIQKVLVHGFPGVRLDGLVVRQKVPQDLGRFVLVAVHAVSGMGAVFPPLN